jgi:hypothetical protein
VALDAQRIGKQRVGMSERREGAGDHQREEGQR